MKESKASKKSRVNALVAVIMGSDSDLPTMLPAVEALKEFGIPYEVKVVSAHRTPHEMIAYASNATERGFKVIIAGAGGAAHLPGMVAAATTLPVIGVPVNIGKLSGVDALLSIVQMPKGVPVATMAIDNAFNAGLFAVRILAVEDVNLKKKLIEFAQSQIEKVNKANQNLNRKL